MANNVQLCNMATYFARIDMLEEAVVCGKS